MRKLRQDPARAAGVRPLAPAELLDSRGGGDHEDPYLWLLLGTLPPYDGIIDPITGTGPTCPPRPCQPV